MGLPSSAGSTDVGGGEAASRDQGMRKVSGMGRSLGPGQEFLQPTVIPSHSDIPYA